MSTSAFRRLRGLGIILALGPTAALAQVTPAVPSPTFPSANSVSQPNAADGATAAPVPIFDPTAVSASPWFTGREVRQELNLTNEQYNKLLKSYTRAWQKYDDAVQKLPSNLTPGDRMLQRQELYRQFYNGFSPSLESAIADPTARIRFQQLQWQYRGFGAFEDPAVQRRLRITADQARQMGTLGADWNGQMMNFARSYANQRQGTPQQFNTARNQFNQQVLSTLTPDQQAIWNSMVGKQYSFSPRDYFGTNIPFSSDRPVTPNGAEVPDNPAGLPQTTGPNLTTNPNTPAGGVGTAGTGGTGSIGGTGGTAGTGGNAGTAGNAAGNAGTGGTAGNAGVPVVPM